MEVKRKEGLKGRAKGRYKCREGGVGTEINQLEFSSRMGVKTEAEERDLGGGKGA